MHRADQRDLVDAVPDPRKQRADLGPALPSMGEIPARALQEQFFVARPVPRLRMVERDLLAVVGDRDVGLGSNESTCDTPPLMNRKITDFALPGKCGARGATGSA